MKRGMIFFILATFILLCAGRGHAKVPRPYEEALADVNKFGKGLEERMVDPRNSGNLNHVTP